MSNHTQSEPRSPHSMRNSVFETTVKASKTRHWSHKGPGRGKKNAIIQPTEAQWKVIDSRQ